MLITVSPSLRHCYDAATPPSIAASSLEGIWPLAAAATASASASAVIAASPLVAVDCGVGSTGILLLPCCQGDAVASCDSRTLVLQCCLLLAERVASMTPQL